MQHNRPEIRCGRNGGRFWPILWVVIFLAALHPAFSQAQEQRPLTFGILSIAQPARLYAAWQPFVDYVSARMGEPIEIIIPRGFDKMRESAASGKVDFLYVNSYVFYRLQEEGKVVPVAQLQNIDGKITRQSVLFVRKDSGIRSVKDLKGKRIAFLSPMAAGGYLAARAYFYRHGLRTAAESEEIFTKNLSNSIHEVLLGDATAGTMCGLNYALMREKINTGDLVIIGRSTDFPDDVIAARAGLAGETVKRFRDIVLAMDRDDEGKKLLAAMHAIQVRKFVPYDSRVEEITRQLIRDGEF